MNHSKKVLSVFSLVMINVIAVDSLRSLPINAKLGLSLVSYYLIASFAFFIPVALIAAELATAYPQTGGIYVWIREAFGKRIAFISIWLQWIYNIVWFPTMLAFIVSTISYLFDPQLANNKLYLLFSSLGLYWLFTLLNCFGMRVSSIISIIGATLGTLLPMLLIIFLAALWMYQGKTMAVGYSTSLIPDFSSLGNLPLFSSVLFSLIGIEMSAVHAEEVKNPSHDYPKALLYSTIIIISTLTLGSLAIVCVVPNEQLSVVSGLIDAYKVFFTAYNMPWMTTVIASLIILGGLSAIAAWIIGPTKGLMVSALDGSLPSWIAKVNKSGVPVTILFVQALIFSALASLFLLSDSINAIYWMLSDLCAQMALIIYIVMFAAAIKLRYTQPDKPRAYKIPGGNAVLWCMGSLGILCCLFAIFIGFIPPNQIPMNNIFLFEGFLIGGLILFIMVPWFLAKKH